MQLASSEVEGTGVEQQESTLSCGNHGQLGEANVIADGDSNLSILGQIDQSDLVSRTQDLALLESNLAGDINVEEVDLSVGGQQVSVRAKDETCVVVFLCVGEVLGDTATDQVGLGLFGQSRQGVEGGRLRLGGW